MLESGADVLSLDWRGRPRRRGAARRRGARACRATSTRARSRAAARTIVARVREIADAGAPARGLSLNLGHGCLPDTPVEGVRAFTDAARALATNESRALATDG